MTDLKVVPLPAPTKEAAQAIEALKALLAEFERGDVDSFMLVAVRSGGGITRARALAPHANRFALVGAAYHDIRSIHELIDAECAVTVHYQP